MTRQTERPDERKTDELDTIWHVPDELWARIEPILAKHDPPKHTGRKRIDARAALDGIIFRLRTGSQWNHFPKELPDDSSVHRTLQRWVEKDLFKQIWAALVEECDELGGVHWDWQAVDTSMGKARSGGDKVGANPTDRAKAGVKRSLHVEADGGPLGVVIDGANRHDAKLLSETLAALVVERPEPTEEAPQHLCLDKAYDNPTGEAAVADYGCVPHIRRIGEEKLDATGQKRYPARRWVVERTLAWLSKCRGLLVRYEKKAAYYLALIQFACALLWFRRLHRLSVLR